MSQTRYVLRGFTHMGGYRVFAFEGIANNKERTMYTVRADLAMSQRYGVPLQELPLLCRGVLERDQHDGQRRVFAYTEEDMRRRAQDEAAEEARKRNRAAPKRPYSEKVGAAWRAMSARRS